MKAIRTVWERDISHISIIGHSRRKNFVLAKYFMLDSERTLSVSSTIVKMRL